MLAEPAEEGGALHELGQNGAPQKRIDAALRTELRQVEVGVMGQLKGAHGDAGDDQRERCAQQGLWLEKKDDEGNERVELFLDRQRPEVPGVPASVGVVAREQKRRQHLAALRQDENVAARQQLKDQDVCQDHGKDAEDPLDVELAQADRPRLDLLAKQQGRDEEAAEREEDVNAIAGMVEQRGQHASRL